MNGQTEQAVLQDPSDPELRRSMVGGSDAAKALDLSEYGTALDLYLEKIGVTEGFEGNEFTEAGKWLEPMILARFAHEEGVLVLGRNRAGRPTLFCPDLTERVPDGSVQKFLVPLLGTVRDPDMPFRGCHIDGLSLADSDGAMVPTAIIEAKSGSFFAAAKWGEPGTDEIPVDYLVQCYHNASVLFAKIGLRLDVVVPTILGGHRWGVFGVEFSEEGHEALRVGEAKFWEHVQTQTPPPPKLNRMGFEALNRLYPTHEESEIRTAVDDELHNLATHYLTAAERLKSAKAEKDGLGVRIKELMGTAGRAVGRGWSATWKTPKAGQVVDFRAAFEAVCRDHSLPAEVVDQYTADATKSRNVSRTFRIQSVKAKD